MEWIEQYLENYNGKSELAKECEQYIKENYKGDAYLPWAFMIRCLYTQDPSASCDVIENTNGGILHLDTYQITTKTQEMEAVATVVCPSVCVEVVFLGKRFTEYYPVQDKAYDAPKAINQNDLNKAKQRCIARTISMATGIGWRLYEGKDLQFEDSPAKSNVSPEPVKQTVTEKLIEKGYDIVDVSDETKAEVNGASEEAKTLAQFIVDYQDKDKLTKALQGLNVSVIKRYRFAFEVNDTYDNLVIKASKLDKPDKFLASIKNKLG